MAEPVVRTITKDEIDAWATQLHFGFLMLPPEGIGNYFLSWADLDRTRAAFDGDKVVGTLWSFPTELTVPGPSSVRVSALSGVTVAPTHRRQGVLRRLIRHDLDASKERGEVASVLYTSEYPIYGRFGYGVAAFESSYRITSSDLRFRRPTVGSVELVDAPTLRREGPVVYDDFRRLQVGSIERLPHWWDRQLQQVEVPGEEPRKAFQALYRSPEGEIEGYVEYKAKGEWDLTPKGTIEVVDLISTTPPAYQALFDYLAGIDLTTTVTLGDRAIDEALPYLVEDGRAVRETLRTDSLWLRPLDVSELLSQRRYGVSDSLVMQIEDETGFTGGRFRLEGGPEGASCGLTTEDPDLTLPVQVLGSLFLGGVSASLLHLAGEIDENSPRAVTRMDLMFHTARAPWCATDF